MKDRDSEAVTEVLRLWKQSHPEAAASIKRVKVKSPAGNTERDAVAAALGNDITFCESTIQTWNLNEGPGVHLQAVDMVVSCNIFMASPDPLQWLKNIGLTAPYFLLQDLIRAWRGKNETDPETGDIVRYQFTSQGELARPEADNIYDLSQHDEFIDEIIFYDDDGSGIHDCRKFAAIIRVGDLVAASRKIVTANDTTLKSGKKR